MNLWYSNKRGDTQKPHASSKLDIANIQINMR